MSEEVVSLNVGGVIYVTTVATLTQYPDSMIAAMFDPESKRPPAMKDDKGNFFIDSEPEPFKLILRFLRMGRLSENIAGCSLEELEWAADYFGLDKLLEIIRERKKAEEEMKAKEERKKTKEEEEKEKQGPKMSALECEEKAADMRKKSADAKKMMSACTCHNNQCWCCSDASQAAKNYGRLASAYERKAADLRRRGYEN